MREGVTEGIGVGRPKKPMAASPLRVKAGLGRWTCRPGGPGGQTLGPEWPQGWLEHEAKGR